MTKSARTYPKEEVKRSFLPILRQNGWLIQKRSEAFDSPEERRALPFGNITRSTGNAVQMVDIQFDKRGRAKSGSPLGHCHPKDYHR